MGTEATWRITPTELQQHAKEEVAALGPFRGEKGFDPADGVYEAYCEAAKRLAALAGWDPDLCGTAAVAGKLYPGVVASHRRIRSLLRRAQYECGGGASQSLHARARFKEEPWGVRSRAAMERHLEEFLEGARKAVAKLAAEPADPIEHERWLTQRDAVALRVAADAEWRPFLCREAAWRVEQEPLLQQVLLDALWHCDEPQDWF